MNILMHGAGRCPNDCSEGAPMSERHPCRASKMTENMHEHIAYMEQVAVRKDAPIGPRRIEWYARRAFGCGPTNKGKGEYRSE